MAAAGEHHFPLGGKRPPHGVEERGLRFQSLEKREWQASDFSIRPTVLRVKQVICADQVFSRSWRPLSGPSRVRPGHTPSRDIEAICIGIEDEASRKGEPGSGAFQAVGEELLD